MCWDRLIDAEEPAHARTPERLPEPAAPLPESVVHTERPELPQLVVEHAA